MGWAVPLRLGSDVCCGIDVRGIRHPSAPIEVLVCGDLAFAVVKIVFTHFSTSVWARKVKSKRKNPNHRANEP